MATTIGPYEIEGELGRGGAGVVLRAHDARGRSVAVKVLRGSSPESRARFDRERRLLAEFTEEQGFVPVVGTGESAAGPWLAMPLLAGGTLRDRLRRGALPIDDVVALGERLATALGHAHSLGIVHRDLKPENVLFATPAPHQVSQPLVADLGLGKHFAEGTPGASQSVALSREGELRGTAGYMAPEQARDSRSAGPPADVFALGAILYECIAGWPAFEGRSMMELLSRVEEARPTPVANVRPETPPWLAQVVERALARAPEARYADGAALANALRTRDPGLAPAARGGSRQRLLLLGVATALLGGSGGLAVAIPLRSVATAPPAASSTPTPAKTRAPSSVPSPSPSPSTRPAIPPDEVRREAAVVTRFLDDLLAAQIDLMGGANPAGRLHTDPTRAQATAARLARAADLAEPPEEWGARAWTLVRRRLREPDLDPQRDRVGLVHAVLDPARGRSLFLDAALVALDAESLEVVGPSFGSAVTDAAIEELRVRHPAEAAWIAAGRTFARLGTCKVLRDWDDIRRAAGANLAAIRAVGGDDPILQDAENVTLDVQVCIDVTMVRSRGSGAPEELARACATALQLRSLPDPRKDRHAPTDFLLIEIEGARLAGELGRPLSPAERSEALAYLDEAAARTWPDPRHALFAQLVRDFWKASFLAEPERTRALGTVRERARAAGQDTAATSWKLFRGVELGCVLTIGEADPITAMGPSDYDPSGTLSLGWAPARLGERVRELNGR